MADEALEKISDEVPKHEDMIALTCDIVSGYVSNNAVTPSDLHGLIETVFGTLNKVGPPAEPEPRQEPAVPVKRSVKEDSIVCLECGKAQKMLKRHLASAHSLTPEECRAKWNLAHNYPMVSPTYVEKRRDLAKQIGLGQKREKVWPKRKTAERTKGVFTS